MLIHFRLAKAGYGSVAEVEQWGARKVLQALHHETFLVEYDLAFLEINKK